jgi:parvulin-like peptidyl-prolyl isomerase
VEESEIRAFFEREKDRLGDRPATVTFRQALVFPSPSDEAMAAARVEAERIRALILDGEDFADLARRFSGDPGSRQLGGDLGWFRRGSGLVSEFEDAAFALRPGVLSGVVETSYGAHIIKVERVRGAERKIHHILISAEVEAGDAERTRSRAGEILDRVRAGAPVSEFSGPQREMSIPDSLTVEAARLDEYPTGYAAAIRAAAPGDVVGPIAFPTQQGDAYAVVQVLEKREAGEYSYEDVRGLIQERLRNEKFEERLLADLRARTYVEIRL